MLTIRHLTVTVVSAVCVSVLTTPDAHAAPTLPRGNDVSWPQCSTALGGHALPQPVRADLEVIGLTHGLPFTENPCLEGQIAHARSIGARVAAYTFAAMPTASELARDGGSGPYDSSQATGRLANAGYAQGQWAATMLGGYGLDVPFVWLDVEPRKAQPWSKDVSANRAVIGGAVAALQASGRSVGFYSYAYGWRQITGGMRSELAVWATAGHRGLAGALAMCSQASFSGGPVVLAQYYDDVRDSDVACPSIAGGPARTSASALAPFARTVLRRGSTGPAVAALQTRLRLPSHGRFDRSVALKVRLFQRQHGLVTDGVVNPTVWRALGAGEVRVVAWSPGLLDRYFG